MRQHVQTEQDIERALHRTVAIGSRLDVIHPQETILTNQQASVVLGQWLGGTPECHAVAQLSGGICSTVYLLEFSRPPYSAVVKLQRKAEDDPLPRECARLEYLHRHTAVPCPDVYLQDASCNVIPYSFLLLEHFPGKTLEAAAIEPTRRSVVEHELAEVLLELHSHKRATFGDVECLCAGRVWAELFLPDLEEAHRDMAGLLPPATLEILDCVVPLAGEALADQGEPTLIHNDVWAGNIMVEEKSDSWHLVGLLDPVGLQYADVEKEIAYLEAFDTVGKPFFEAYSSSQPLRSGYEFRRLFYSLHTYMVHVWLGFGEEFRDRVGATARQILALAPSE